MRKRLLSCALLFSAMASFGQLSDVKDYITFEPVDPMVKVLREMNYFGNFKDTIDVARGESATFQFAIRSGLPIKNLSSKVVLKCGKGELTDISIGYLEYARAGHPNPEPGVDALKPLSLYYPDPIMIVPTIDVKRDVAQPIWVRVNVPKDAVAGLYNGEIEVTGSVAGQEFKFTKPLELQVHKVVLNEPRLWVTHWYTMVPSQIERYYGRPYDQYSPQYWHLLEESAKKMAYCYQNMALASPLLLTDIKLKDGKYSFDFTNFDKTIEVFEKYGVAKLIEGDHLAKRMGDWSSKFGVSVPTGKVKNGLPELKIYPYDHDSTDNFLKQFLPSLVSHLKSKGWYDKYTQHIADEPTEDNADSYIAIAKKVKHYAPDIKIIEACHSKDLENTIDIWVPQLDTYRANYEFYKERQKAGDEVWFYTCLAPKGEYVNRFLEQPLIKTRLVHWLNYRFGATGYLHWGLFYWNHDDLINNTTAMNTEGGNVLPGGDCWIVYPDKKGGMYGSIRLDAMRDGIADHELLKMLEEKNKPLADELCRQMVYTWSRYDVEPYHFRKIKRIILRELSK